MELFCVIDVLGAVIGVVSGVPLGEYVSQNIFDRSV